MPGGVAHGPGKDKAFDPQSSLDPRNVTRPAVPLALVVGCASISAIAAQTPRIVPHRRPYPVLCPAQAACRVPLGRCPRGAISAVGGSRRGPRNLGRALRVRVSAGTSCLRPLRAAGRPWREAVPRWPCPAARKRKDARKELGRTHFAPPIPRPGSSLALQPVACSLQSAVCSDRSPMQLASPDRSVVEEIVAEDMAKHPPLAAPLRPSRLAAPPRVAIPTLLRIYWPQPLACVRAPRCSFRPSGVISSPASLSRGGERAIAPSSEPSGLASRPRYPGRHQVSVCGRSWNSMPYTRPGVLNALFITVPPCNHVILRSCVLRSWVSSILDRTTCSFLSFSAQIFEIQRGPRSALPRASCVQSHYCVPRFWAGEPPSRPAAGPCFPRPAMKAHSITVSPRDRPFASTHSFIELTHWSVPRCCFMA